MTRAKDLLNIEIEKYKSNTPLSFQNNLVSGKYMPGGNTTTGLETYQACLKELIWMYRQWQWCRGSHGKTWKQRLKIHRGRKGYNRDNGC